MNYKVQFVNLETGYTTIQVYPTIEKSILAITELMHNPSKYRITITTKTNK